MSLGWSGVALSAGPSVLSALLVAAKMAMSPPVSGEKAGNVNTPTEIEATSTDESECLGTHLTVVQDTETKATSNAPKHLSPQFSSL